MSLRHTALAIAALALGVTGVATAGPASSGPVPVSSHSPNPEYKTPPGWSAAYTPAVRIGNLLYTSGQIGTLPGTDEFAPGGIEAETRQALENLRTIVEENGSSMDRVVKCLVMLADFSERPKMNEVYVSFFPVNKPARSAFGTNGLYGGARVEIECIAALK